MSVKNIFLYHVREDDQVSVNGLTIKQSGEQNPQDVKALSDNLRVAFKDSFDEACAAGLKEESELVLVDANNIRGVASFKDYPRGLGDQPVKLKIS